MQHPGAVLTGGDADRSGPATIRSVRLSTENIRPQDQLDAWQSLTAGITDVEPIGDPSQGFHGSMDIHDLGALQVVGFDMDPVAYRHTDEHLRKSGIDDWWLTVVNEGSFRTQAQDRSLEASAGSVLLRSWVYPFEGVLEKTKYTCFFMGRDQFADIADQLDSASHRFVSGPMMPILRDFLMSVSRHLPHLTPPDVATVNEAFSGLVKAVCLGTADAQQAARQPIAASQFERARRFINDNLASPALNVDAVADSLGISRRQLYYLFASHGGVVKFIQDRRLAACYKRIKTLTDGRAIRSVAYEFGFINLSTFYRQFQARYGFRPSEARAAWLSGHRPDATEARSFAEWMSLVADR
jgi:AraC-like DNA-binding protein